MKKVKEKQIKSVLCLGGSSSGLEMTPVYLFREGAGGVADRPEKPQRRREAAEGAEDPGEASGEADKDFGKSKCLVYKIFLCRETRKHRRTRERGPQGVIESTPPSRQEILTYL